MPRDTRQTVSEPAADPVPPARPTPWWLRIHNNISVIKEYAELLGAVLVFFGAVMAYFQYVDGQRKEQQDLGERAYSELQDSYFDLLAICLQYPNLDCYDNRRPNAPCLTPEEERQQDILYGMIISVFERAYVRYEVNKPPRHAEQWPGWVKYMEGFAERDGMRRGWSEVRDEFDSGFADFYDALLARVPPAPTPPCTPRQ